MFAMTVTILQMSIRALFFTNHFFLYFTEAGDQLQNKYVCPQFRLFLSTSTQQFIFKMQTAIFSSAQRSILVVKGENPD